MSIVSESSPTQQQRDEALEAGCLYALQPAPAGPSAHWNPATVLQGLRALAERQGVPFRKSVPRTLDFLIGNLLRKGSITISIGNLAVEGDCSTRSAIDHVQLAERLGLIQPVDQLKVSKQGRTYLPGPALQPAAWADLCRVGKQRKARQSALNERDSVEGDGLDRVVRISSRKRQAMGSVMAKLPTTSEVSAPPPTPPTTESSTDVWGEVTSLVQKVSLYSTHKGSEEEHLNPKRTPRDSPELLLVSQLNDAVKSSHPLLHPTGSLKECCPSVKSSSPLRYDNDFTGSGSPLNELESTITSPVEPNMTNGITYGSVVLIKGQQQRWIVHSLDWGASPDQDIARCHPLDDDATWITSRISDLTLVDSNTVDSSSLALA